MSTPRRADARNPTYFQGDLSRALLDAANEAVAELGPAAVSLREIARKVGVSHAAPAHHFGDKAGLFTALATEGFELLGTAVRGETVKDPEGTRSVSLVDAGVAYIRFATTYRGHFEVMWRTDLLRADDPAYIEAAARAFDALVDAVNLHQAAGWAPGRDPMELTIHSWALVHGLATLHNAGALAWATGDRSVEEVARSVTAMVTHAFDAAQPLRSST